MWPAQNMAADFSSNTGSEQDDAKAAADVIREKVARIYDEEPNARRELAESEAAKPRSKHQQFMHELSTSGKDLVTIQTEWHNYYQKLTPTEKHEVWQEFYASQSAVNGAAEPEQATPKVEDPHTLAEHKQPATRKKPRKRKTAASKPKLRDARSVDDAKKTIQHKVSAGGKLTAKHHLQSVLFGLAMGAVVLVIFLFSFFNEVIIAPFIQPSRVASSTPIIVGSETVAPTDKNEVIIPKINVEIPTDFSATSINENEIENNLENGVVHYPTTALPGQNGNAAFFGHSSNNIFNKGKYKFAFVLLHTMEKGDTFYLTYNGKVYVYKVIDKKVVDPSEVGVLDPVPGQAATATLITCDPPGTSLKRLVVIGQQISPDPSGNAAAATNQLDQSNNTAANLPGNGPTLWTSIMRTAIGKLVLSAVLLGALILTLRWLRAPLRLRQA